MKVMATVSDQSSSNINPSSFYLVGAQASTLPAKDYIVFIVFREILLVL
jgi:hypothetical protein